MLEEVGALCDEIRGIEALKRGDETAEIHVCIENMRKETEKEKEKRCGPELHRAKPLAVEPNASRIALGWTVRRRRWRRRRTSSLIASSASGGRSWTTKSNNAWESRAAKRAMKRPRGEEGEVKERPRCRGKEMPRCRDALYNPISLFPHGVLCEAIADVRAHLATGRTSSIYHGCCCCTYSSTMQEHCHLWPLQVSGQGLCVSSPYTTATDPRRQCTCLRAPWCCGSGRRQRQRQRTGHV